MLLLPLCRRQGKVDRFVFRRWCEPPDAVGDLRHVGGGVRGDADGFVYAEEEVTLTVGAGGRVSRGHWRICGLR